MQHVNHFRPHHARDMGHQNDGNDRCGHDQMGHSAPEILCQRYIACWRQDLPAISEEQQRQRGGDKFRQRHPDIGNETDSHVDDLAATHRSENTQRHRDEQHQADGKECEKQRAAKSLDHDRPDGQTGAQGRAEITLKYTQNPVQILRPDRIVQPHLLPKRTERFLGRVFAQHHHRRIGRQNLGHGENDQRHDQERIENQGRPLC